VIASSNELIYFIELARTLNFSRASERIGISQPTLSAAIKRLEHSIGTKLFVRDKHTVLLTQAGKNLLSHAQALIQLWDVTKANCLASQNEVQGSIILGCHPSIALYFLPRFLPALLTKYPKLEIKLKHDLSRKIAEEIINITIDIGIVVNPIRHPDLIIKKLFDDEVTYWQSKSPPTKMLVSEEKVIICDPDLKQTQFLLKKTTSKNLKYKRVITTNSLEIVANLTAAGVGVGVLPGTVVKSLHPLKLYRIPGAPSYHDEICLVFRHENRNTEALKAVIDAIKNIKCD
jgi:LysR family transcriptional regulator, cell division regulator